MPKEFVFIWRLGVRSLWIKNTNFMSTDLPSHPQNSPSDGIAILWWADMCNFDPPDGQELNENIPVCFDNILAMV